LREAAHLISRFCETSNMAGRCVFATAMIIAAVTVAVVLGARSGSSSLKFQRLEFRFEEFESRPNGAKGWSCTFVQRPTPRATHPAIHAVFSPGRSHMQMWRCPANVITAIAMSAEQTSAWLIGRLHVIGGSQTPDQMGEAAMQAAKQAIKNLNEWWTAVSKPLLPHLDAIMFMLVFYIAFTWRPACCSFRCCARRGDKLFFSAGCPTLPPPPEATVSASPSRAPVALGAASPIQHPVDRPQHPPARIRSTTPPPKPLVKDGLMYCNSDAMQHSPQPVPVQPNRELELLEIINNGTCEAIQRVHGLGPRRAASILEYRKLHGPFACFDDIQSAGVSAGVVKKCLVN